MATVDIKKIAQDLIIELRGKSEYHKAAAAGAEALYERIRVASQAATTAEAVNESQETKRPSSKPGRSKNTKKS